MTTCSSDEALWLTEEHLKALVAPRTREVFEAFRVLGPTTVDEIQKALDCPSKTIYYQVDKLLKTGLLSEAGLSKGKRRERQVYESVKGALRMPEGYQGARYEQLAAKGVSATLRSIIRRFNETARQAEAHPDLVDDLYIRTAALKLSGPEVAEFKKRLQEMVGEFAARDSPEGRAVSFTGVLTPHEGRLGRKD